MRKIRGHFLSFLQTALVLTGVPAHANTPPLVCEYGLIEVHSPNADFISSQLIHIGRRLDSLRRDENLILDAMDETLRADGHPDLVRAVQDLIALDSQYQKEPATSVARTDLLKKMAAHIGSMPEFGVYQDSGRALGLAKSISNRRLALPGTAISSREAVHLTLHLQSAAPNAAAKTRVNSLIMIAQTREMLARVAQDFRELMNDSESGEIGDKRDLQVQFERTQRDLRAARAVGIRREELAPLDLKSRRLERLSGFLEGRDWSSAPPF